MPDNYYSEVNDHGNVIPIRDLAAVAWADAGKYVGKNKLDVPNKQTIGSSIFYADADKYVTSPQSDERSWNYNNSNLKISLKAGKYNLRVFRKTACSSGYNGFKLYNDSTVIYQNETIEGAVNAGDIALNLANDSNIGIFYKLGNGAYAFQITEEGVPTTPYTPYIPDNTELMTWEANAVLGAKNLNYWDASTSTGGNGVTYTVNANKTVSLSGTSTNSGVKDLRTYTGEELKALGKDLILNGGNAKAYLAIRDASYNFIARSYGEDAPFDTSTLTDGTTYYETIGITSSGIDTTGVVIKPMIRLASDTDSTYQPFAMTNRELTDWADTKVNTDSTTGIKYYKSGNTVTVFFDDSSNVTTSEAYETIFTLPTGYRPKVQVSFKDSYSSKRVVISNSGAIQCNETLSNVALRGCITYVV